MYVDLLCLLQTSKATLFYKSIDTLFSLIFCISVFLLSFIFSASIQTVKPPKITAPNTLLDLAGLVCCLCVVVMFLLNCIF